MGDEDVGNERDGQRDDQWFTVFDKPRAFKERGHGIHEIFADQDAGDEKHVGPHEQCQEEAGRTLEEVQTRGCAASLAVLPTIPSITSFTLSS
ncbi:MAG: hypothetical protein IE886_01230 [Campylobacterales bacterium]|nr:hypothetical protein [Campylobacterales bacterium]